LAHARSLDPDIARTAGVTAVVELIGCDDGEIEAIDFDDTEVLRLIAEKAVAPITDLDELISLFSQVLEGAGNADEVERVLDGVSRLCDRVPNDFEARTGPLPVGAGPRPRPSCRGTEGGGHAGRPLRRGAPVRSGRPR
jgi:hypothetical protein